jgi:hypothetical protein
MLNIFEGRFLRREVKWSFSTKIELQNLKLRYN